MPRARIYANGNIDLGTDVRGTADTNISLDASRGSINLGAFNDTSNTNVGMLLDINTNSSQIYMQADSTYSTANSAIEVYRGSTKVWSVTYGGTAAFSNTVLSLPSGDLDVGDKLKKADDALEALKAAAAASSDFASLKAAIATALANH